MDRTDKNTRILKLYDMLLNGKFVNKTLFSLECNVSERAFDRDIEDIRLYLSENFSPIELLFDKSRNGYYLSAERRRELFANELLPILKVLLDSKAFRSDEMLEVSETLMSIIDRKDVSKLKALIGDEVANYQSQPEKKGPLKIIWDLSECVFRRTKIKIHNHVAGQEARYLVVSPISVVFLKNNFYLVAFVEGKGDEYPNFFPVDDINSFEVLNQSVFIRSTQICDIAEIKDNFNKSLDFRERWIYQWLEK